MKREAGFLCFLLAFALSMAALPAMAAPIRVDGHIYWEGASGGYYVPNPGTKVKFCRNNGTVQAASGQGPTCVDGKVGGTGNDSNYYQVFVPVPGAYWMFTWNTDNDWGSSTSITRGVAGGYHITQVNVPSYYIYDIHLYSAPSPHKPSAVYPLNGAVRTPATFTLKWTTGLDAERMATKWPVTYDIYANGPGAAENLVLSNIPCNADTSGNCTYPISNLLSAQLYYWRVEAKLNTQLGSPGDTYNRSARATPSTFTTNGTTYSLLSETGYFVGADGCGNATVSAKSTSLGPCQTLKLVDLNGGTLESGDPVYIELYATPWNFTAANGGGGWLYATSQWGGWYETFTVSKVSGGGTLQNGDQVTVQAYYGQYCAAIGGGNDRVNCVQNAVGPWETFTLGIN